MHRRVKDLLERILQTEVVLEHPKERALGHYASVVAFPLAKVYKKAPKIIAEDLAKSLSAHPECQAMFSQIAALNGYINFTLKQEFLNDLCDEALSLGEGFGQQTGKEESFYVEFVSANPTGPLHIGHARGAVFGDSFCRLARFLGYRVHSEYYINDLGAQIKKLGLSVFLRLKQNLGFEVEYPQECHKGEYIQELAQAAQEHFKIESLEGADEKVLIARFGDFSKDLMLAEIQDTLADMGLKMDAYVSEKVVFAKSVEVFKRLETSGGVYENEGKLWLKSSAFGDEKDRVVRKADGDFTYLAPDIVYHDYKFRQDYSHYINIFGADHHGYVPRIKASLKFLGYEASKLEVLLVQMVALIKEGQPYKMSKRAGNYVLVKDVLQDMGKDALRFIFLSKKLDTHLDFDVASLQKQDSTNPIFYIHYANARIHTMLEKFVSKGGSLEKVRQSPLLDLPPAGQNLLFSALNLPKVLQGAFSDRELQKICDYLKALAADLHSFYNAHRILDTPQELPYLKLCQMVSLSLTIGLNILGIEAKKKM
ncbi:arginine--tRNA ligase [Helicobacter ailurogastricus]|uniref:arginine--tRNA ligase n=1 Tax=Helicobacter ailurogastricus TaxID=1578720 RepID=UPI0022C7F696|nr:arginine--tRNA ligase [Helicobacter ailurogastricus]GLH57763.1 Arginyl-tRNA synthetase ArgS [Helicobacter ailurogastricus]GLH59257.1 Arginyl-tRNA synthetase ArgS [Helicobacter ailurogastricus]